MKYVIIIAALLPLSSCDILGGETVIAPSEWDTIGIEEKRYAEMLLSIQQFRIERGNQTCLLITVILLLLKPIGIVRGF
ncbi:hypothetical protein WJU16_02895 [Chitinophaga pollutisoli]|uniref:Uncharacterized protein n=1 Tax=Chitinophaga pollutisoli TaxID=3133966 RepID=A0ABZ2YRJ4_9BACT